MTDTERILEFTRSCFTDNCTVLNTSNSNIPTNNAIFKYRLITDTTGDNFEVPTLILADNPFNAYPNFPRVKIVSSLFDISFYIKRTIGTAFWEFRYASSYNRLCKVFVKDTTYHGCIGLILDDEFNPLLITTYCFTRQNEDSVLFTGIKVNINRKVFERQNEIMPKTILKKLLPYFSTNTIPVYIRRNYMGECIPEVVIGSLDDMVVKTVPPVPSTATNENFNNILKAHINDL